MNERDREDGLITRYLLGETSEQERAQVEERYFTDPGFLDQVLVIEDDLVDAYARGKLTSREDQLFESHFMASPARREKAQMAKTLAKCLSETPILTADAPVAASGKQFWPMALRLALAASLLVAVITALWLVVENRGMRKTLDEERAEKARIEQQLADERTRSERPAREREQSAPGQTEQEPATTRQSAVASFALLPGLSRDVEELQKVSIPPAAQLLSFQLSIESTAEYRSYRAELRRGSDRIWSRDDVKIQRARGGRVAILNLPANLFTAGHYTFTLTGVTTRGTAEVINDYPFTVAKK